MRVLTFDNALGTIQNNDDDRKLKDRFYKYKAGGLLFEHNGSNMVRFSFHDFEKHQHVDGELSLHYECCKDVVYTDSKGNEQKMGCTFPFGDDVRPGGKGVEFFQVDTNSPIPGDSVQLWSNLNIRFNGKESTYYLKVDEDINDENRHMSIKQMAAHLAAVYCEHLNKSIQDEDGRQIGAQLTKMILKLGRSDVFDGPKLDRAYQLDEYKKAVSQKSMQRQTGKSEKVDSKSEPRVQTGFDNEYYGEKTLQFLKNFKDSQNQ